MRENNTRKTRSISYQINRRRESLSPKKSSPEVARPVRRLHTRYADVSPQVEYGMDSEYRQLIDEFMHVLPDVLACLQLTREQLPWLWSADFIRRTDGGSYAISEFVRGALPLLPCHGRSLDRGHPDRGARARPGAWADELGRGVVETLANRQMPLAARQTETRRPSL